MESDMAVSMLRRSSSHGKVQVKSITTDNDTTTSLKVKTEIRRDIKQIKDFNHTKKNLQLAPIFGTCKKSTRT